MYSKYNFIKDLNPTKEEWRIEARVVRTWKVPNFQQKHFDDNVEMILLDEKGGRVHAAVKGSLHIRKKIHEGEVYFIKFFGVGLNSGSFRPTKHDYRLSFNLRTDVKSTIDSAIPTNGFDFVDFDVIKKESSDSPYLVDVIGLVSGIGEVRKHIISGRKTKMVVVELDNLRLSSDVIDSVYTLSQLSSQSSYSFENDFLKETKRKCISDVKNCSEVTTCITYRTIKLIESKYNWWYKSCNKCPYSVCEDFEKWYCKNCQKHLDDYYPKFCVQLRVVDHTDSASFILFDRDCVALLGMSAADLREQHFKRGVDLEHYPKELNVLIDKSMMKDYLTRLATVPLHQQNQKDSPNTGLDIDNLISAEIPNKDSNPSLFAAVTCYMMHGPCGPDNYKSPCMKNGHCSKKFPKKFCSRTFIDDNGFPRYRRRNDGSVVKKNGVELDNCYVVPYVSACEAAWRIFGFEIHYRFPPVQRLPFHLPNEKSVVFSDHASITDVKTGAESRQSMFESWMDANKKYQEGRNLTYADYEDLRTVNGVLFPTYKDVCYSLGLLDDDNEYIDAIKEASSWGSATYLRNLFALLLFGNSMNKPENVFQKCWELLSDDVLYRHRQRIGREDDLLTEDSIKNITLAEIDKVLQSNSKCLSDYPSMPSIIDESLLDMQNRLVMDEFLYDRFSLKEEHDRLLNSLTDEQRVVYDKIISAVSAGKGGFFFLYGFGGTGKTFIWNTLSAFVRSRAEIVLNVASSGIASPLLPGGRTIHSRFRIPIQITEDSTCNIKQNSTLAELLSKTKLIIWDEAPMVHKFCFEALDRTLRDVLRFNDTNYVDMPFGGKVVVLGGVFRQILHVIPNGSRQDIVHETINSSYLWSHCHLLSLTKNMRLNSGSSTNNLLEIKEFFEWLLKIGDGDLGDDVDGESIITIPDELLIKGTEDPLSDIVDFVYPNLMDNILDPTIFKERALLTPKLSDATMLNEYLMAVIPGEERTFLSSDKVLKQDGNSSLEDDEISPDILNTFSCSGIPDHKLTLKVKVPVMLLRNIDQSRGLCNGTRLLITKLENHVVEAIVLTGNKIGDTVLIPRMTISPSGHTFPVNFQRRQFPLVVSFAMTINKSQGQSLSHVGIYLPRPVFTHGQSYMALSRVKSRHGLKMLILDENGCVTNTTFNIVYKEVFQRLV
ncbi:uncharacterized protein LOC133307903 [Gastrolobium bilobum]|uniref:uncharacterized protein LOC133307903 n=1 Tax=Gastrolobium bilobum TaxID=150636 RepID=UPI002AB2738D|nr:uncharacterized protein LOC133307903 [Gastrolobium bilobum]